MIGLWAAVALFGGAVWLALDTVYVRRNEAGTARPELRTSGRVLDRVLAEADLNVPSRVLMLISAGGALVLFVTVYQAMDGSCQACLPGSRPRPRQ